jgi:ABC-2 type transport system ATP-binding protein
MLALLGPNGAGKTTTVRILSTLLQPDAGTITVNGLNVVDQADEVRSVIGLTGQYAAVDELLTGRENLEMMGRLYHLSKEDSKRRAEELLVQFDLVEAANRQAKSYSGGMRRRLDLGASLVATPPIIFLDEPTTGLDPRSRLAMWDVIEQLKRDGATILLTTQYLEEADKLADRIAVIDHGKVIAEGTADELKAKVGKERLELVIDASSDFEKAKQVMNSGAVQANSEERSISIPMEGDVHEIGRILDTMQQAGIKIESLSLHKPTLDDVFLQLTGHEAEDEASEEKK